MKELLVPAGNMDCLYQAINNGCDAVYVSLKKYGARKFAQNFTNDEIINAINLCHLYNVKIYVTMNTLVKNGEVDDFIDTVRFLHRNGVDAIIMQDFGMICLIREMFPNLDIHASTQFNNSSKETCELLYKLGVKRIVFSRELSLDEIDSIDVPIEKEAFIHGALCISYSGCCLMSSMLGGRSGNRGECAGCCRMPFTLMQDEKVIRKNQYLLSTKELNTSSQIRRLLNSSIYSFKIEGRMKSPLYVGFITNFYRKLIDGKLIRYEEELDKLKTIFNREYTLGRLFDVPDKDLMNIKSPNHIGLKIGRALLKKDKIKLLLNDGEVLHQFDAVRFLKSNKGMIINYLYDKSGNLCNEASGVCYIDNKVDLNGEDILCKTQDSLLEKQFINFDRKIGVKFNVIAKTNKELKVSICDGNNTITEIGSIVLSSINAPVDTTTFEKHLSKLGNSPFIMTDISIDMDNNVFIPIKEINDIRRTLVDKLIHKREKKDFDFEENKPKFDFNEEIIKNDRIVCSVFTEEQLKMCLKYSVDRVYVKDKELYERYKKYDSVFYFMDRCKKNITECLVEKNLCSEIFDFIKKIYGNYSMNVFNIYTAFYLKKFGLRNVPLSVELDYNEIEEFVNLYNMKFGISNFELLCYGKVENMLIKGNVLNIDEDTFNYKLIDFQKRSFDVYFDGNNTHIYNYEEKNIDIFDKKIVKRLDFYREDQSTTENIIRKFLKI